MGPDMIHVSSKKKNWDVNHGELGPNNKDFSFHGLCRFQSFDELEAGQAIGKETYKERVSSTSFITTLLGSLQSWWNMELEPQELDFLPGRVLVINQEKLSHVRRLT